MKLISKTELEQMINAQADFQLVDVREDYEFEEQNLGGVNIPLDNILSNLDKLEKNKPVVFCCKTGKRSGAMAHTLERKFGMKNLMTLQGGLTTFFGE